MSKLLEGQYPENVNVYDHLNEWEDEQGCRVKNLLDESMREVGIKAEHFSDFGDIILRMAKAAEVLGGFTIDMPKLDIIFDAYDIFIKKVG